MTLDEYHEIENGYEADDSAEFDNGIGSALGEAFWFGRAVDTYHAAKMEDRNFIEDIRREFAPSAAKAYTVIVVMFLTACLFLAALAASESASPSASVRIPDELIQQTATVDHSSEKQAARSNFISGLEACGYVSKIELRNRQVYIWVTWLYTELDIKEAAALTKVVSDYYDGPVCLMENDTEMRIGSYSIDNGIASFSMAGRTEISNR